MPEERRSIPAELGKNLTAEQAGSCRDVAVRDATARANREADRKYPDTKGVSASKRARVAGQRTAARFPKTEIKQINYHYLKGAGGHYDFKKPNFKSAAGAVSFY
jgi:hypothetical protein